MVALAAKCWLEGNDVGLDCEIVLSAAEQEVAVHAPVLVVRVAHDPVFLLRLVVVAPSDKHDRVILVLPGQATALHGLRAWLFLGLLLLLTHLAVSAIVFWLLLLFQGCWLVAHF